MWIFVILTSMGVFQGIAGRDVLHVYKHATVAMAVENGQDCAVVIESAEGKGQPSRQGARDVMQGEDMDEVHLMECKRRRSESPRRRRQHVRGPVPREDARRPNRQRWELPRYGCSPAEGNETEEQSKGAKTRQCAQTLAGCCGEPAGRQRR